MAETGSHVHLSLEELRSTLRVDEWRGEQSLEDFLLDFGEKISSCQICRERLSAFYDAVDLFGVEFFK